jgi:hypothetical protein
MSNRIDFFQSEQKRLSLPVATVAVFVDGSLCQYLELIEIVRGGWPQFSYARLAYNPAVDTGSSLVGIEDIEAVLAVGKTVRIEQVYNDAAPDISVGSLPVSCGQIETIETRLSSDGERVEIEVRDFSANLNRISVYGRRVVESDGSTVFLSGADTVFNEDGKGNAANEPIENDGESYTVFCAEPSGGRFFSYAEAIDYLLCEYLPSGRLRRPSIEQLRILTEDQIVRDLDVTGLNLLEALHRCCERIGLQFRFVPRFVPTGPEQAIVFYKSGTGRAVELNYQRTGETLSISKTNIGRLHSRRNYWPITHKYRSQGDFKVYEATFELVKAWDAADESTDYDTFSPSTNPDFYKVKDVYRKWCLNEAGGYSGEPFNQGDAFDFSKIFEGDEFVHRRRRFLPALTADKNGKSLGYFLQVSYDDGWHWWQYLHAFNNLLDECGIWLSSDQLDVDTWIAALKEVLRFRITASVVSDQRLSCAIANGPTDSVVPVVEHIITLPRQFKYRKVTGKSIFANVTDDSLGQPDVIDDSAGLYEYVRKQAIVSSQRIETIDVQTLNLVLDYNPGDRVTSSAESRDVLGCKNDNRSIYWIEQVQMDFEKQCTNLKIVRQRSW